MALRGFQLRREPGHAPLELDGALLGLGAPPLLLGQALMSERQGYEVGDPACRRHVGFRILLRRVGQNVQKAQDSAAQAHREAHPRVVPPGPRHIGVPLERLIDSARLGTQLTRAPPRLPRQLLDVMGDREVLLE